MRGWISAALSPAVVALVGLGLGAVALPARAQVELSMSAWVPPSHMLVKDGMVPWMKEVERVTEGRVKIKLLPKPVTNAINHFDAVRDGLADVAFVSHAYTPARFQMVRVGVLPFSGDNAEVNSVALWRIYSKHFLKQDEHKGVKLLTIYTHGPGIFWNARKPIKTVEDFAGLKIRVGGGIAADVANALGVNTISKPAPESYELLSSGVVDGVMFPGESIVSFKLDKLVKYATQFPGGLYSDSHSVIMNLDRWNKISKADQEAIDKVSNEAFARNVGKAWDNNAGSGFDAFKAAGGAVIPADAALVKAVAEKTAHFEQEWVKMVDGKGLDGKAILSEYRAEVKKLTAAK
jgi:TRAP-type C4-dicarboxylate transport system substrate-binding protein